MGQCLVKLPHSCGTRNGLQVFEQDDGSVDGYCYSCNTYVKHPYGEPKNASDIPKAQRLTKTKEEIAQEIAEIASYPVVNLPDRKLRAESLNHFGIRIGMSEQDGITPTLHYYPYTKDGEIVGYKVRLIENKRIWSIGNQRGVDFFGWTQAIATGARRLIITEGELDAVAVYRILEMHTKEDYKDSTPAVVSLPHGAGSAARDVARLLPEIRKYFKQVSLCFDNDEPGKKATSEVLQILGNADVISLPAKDANECIIQGIGKAAYAAIRFNATKPKNTRLVWGRDVHEAAKEPAKWGLSWPWKGMTELTRGIRFGETTYIGAGEKMGKSEIVNALAKHLIVEHDLKVLLAKPEESNNKTYKLLNAKVTGSIFHDPKVEFDIAAYETGGKLIRDKVCMLDLYQRINWEGLKNDIHCAVNEGIRAVFIDPITNLTNGLSAGEVNETLSGIAPELAAMAKDLEIAVFIFCHLNKPPKGSTPWDRGGIITTDYFAGSSAMARSCNYAIGLQGNKDPDLPHEERNMRELVLLADREFGESGKVKLYWDNKTGLFNEVVT